MRLDIANSKLSAKTPIRGEMVFTVRTENCLRRRGLETLGDVAELNERDLTSLRGFGKKCLDEVKKVLSEAGLSLKPIPGLPAEILQLPLRTRQILSNRGVYTLEMLTDCDPEDMCTYWGIGRKGLRGIRDILESAGLRLRGE